MQLATLLSVALGGLAFAEASAATLFSNSPLLLWSPERPIFLGKNVYSSAPMDQRDIVEALARVAKRDSNSDPWGILGEQREAFEQAELLCVFLLPSLGSEELGQLAAPGGKSFVQEAVQQAASSVVVPHTTRSRPLRDVLVNPAVPSIPHTELEALISSGGAWHNLLSDDKTDVVVVEISSDSLPEADAAIRASVAALTKVLPGQTDFALVGNDAGSIKVQGQRGRKLAAQAATTTAAAIVCDAGYFLGTNAVGKAFCFSHYVNMTPELLTGLIFGLFFVFLAYVGLSVLHAIQTPAKYPLHGPPRGKEF